MTQTSKRLEKMLFMNCWKAMGALVRLKGIIDHSNDLLYILKTVFHSSLSAMQTK